MNGLVFVRRVSNIHGLVRFDFYIPGSFVVLEEEEVVLQAT